MIIERSPAFKKSYKKRIASNPTLVHKMNERNHALTGNRRGVRAFSITGDIRIIYEPIDDRNVRLIDIGSHNQIY